MGLEHATTPYCVRLSPSHVGGRAVISQNFRRHFALIIIAGSTVEVLLSTCQVGETGASSPLCQSTASSLSIKIAT